MPIFQQGRLVYEMPRVQEIADYVKRQLTEEIWEEEQRFENPHTHYMAMTPRMYEVKMSMLHDSRESEA